MRPHVLANVAPIRPALCGALQPAGHLAALRLSPRGRVTQHEELPSPRPDSFLPREPARTTAGGPSERDACRRHDWIAEAGRQQREVHGRYLRTATSAPLTPMPRRSVSKEEAPTLGYQTHYVVDGGKRRIILGVLVTPGEVMENQPMLDLAWHVRFRWKLHPRQVTGDTTYGTVENIRGVEDMGIRAYMPLPDWEQKSPYFGASTSPTTPSTTTMSVPGPGAAPALRLHGWPARSLPSIAPSDPPPPVRSEHSARRCPRRRRSFGARSRQDYIGPCARLPPDPAYHKAMRKRQVWVEPLFAEGKQWHQMRRFRLRRCGESTPRAS